MSNDRASLTNRQLLRIEDLLPIEVQKLLEKALISFKGQFIRSQDRLAGIPLALIFAEPSTRTRLSFELAARSLGLQPYLMESASSSLTKGEDLLDTVQNLQAMGINHFVVRTDKTPQLLELKSESVVVLNAGDGVGEHPTQALLDLLTLLLKSGSWENLLKTKITIVGNLSHSRVVNSWISLGKLLNLNLSFVSPPEWAPQDKDVSWTPSLEDGLRNCDVVMALRVQKERLGAQSLDLSDYIKKYQVTPSLLSDRPLMHPGPVNWGVEVCESIREYANSLILDQVRCGCHLRATLLSDFIATP